MAEVLKMRFLVRSRTAAAWTALNEVLLASTSGTGAREMGMEEDTGKFKLGDGVSAWNDLPYQSAGRAATPMLVNVQTGTSYTLVAGDAGGDVQCGNAAPVTVTIPKDTFNVGDWLLSSQIGAGTVTYVCAAGVTFETAGTKATSVKGDMVWLEMVAVNVWRFVRYASGLPAGGTIGQVLTKKSATDGDADWEASTGGVVTIVSGRGVAVDSTDAANPVVSSTLGSIALSGNPADYAALPSGLGSGDAGKAYLLKSDGLVYIWDGALFPASGAGVSVGGGGGGSGGLPYYPNSYVEVIGAGLIAPPPKCDKYFWVRLDGDVFVIPGYKVNPLRMVSGTSISLVQGATSSAQIEVAGEVSPYVWTVNPSTPLPIGITLSASGLLTDTGLAPVGKTTVNMTATGKAGTSISIDFTITVVVAATGSLWWRIRITSNNGDDNTSIAEIGMSVASSEANLCTGGTAFASSTYSGSYPPSYAFDNSNGTRWAALGTSGFPVSIGYKMSASKQVNSVSIRAPGETAMAPPKDFSIQSSNNSTNGVDGTWVTEWTPPAQTGWTTGQVRVFDRP